MKTLLIVGMLGAAAMVPAFGASTAKPAISDDAVKALEQMAATLQAKQFSFNARTLRVYENVDGRYLHIEHNFKVTVRRPDRLRVDLNGDDGPKQLLYDGKTLSLFAVDKNGYVAFPVPDTIAGMLKEAQARVGFDFPLADFLNEAPGKALLTGVSDARIVDDVTVDGVPSVHMTLFQPPGLEQEIWLSKDKGVPERVFITFRSMPGQPTFFAEFSDWNFAATPTDADFVFTPPAGATQVELKPVSAAPPAKAKGDTK